MRIEQRIECNTTEKLLARVTVEGIKLWCAQHKREELVTWEQLDTLRDSLFEIIASNQTAIISH
jgi:hypothetical protein